MSGLSKRYAMTPEDSLRARRAILVSKIAQETDALENGGYVTAAPAEYKSVSRRTRRERLDDWIRMLAVIDEDLAAAPENKQDSVAV
jgi:hypothetical protein